MGQEPISRMHPWHDTPLGDKWPAICNAVIEIPAGGKVKYEVHKATGMLYVDRVLHSSVRFPHNYGLSAQPHPA